MAPRRRVAVRARHRWRACALGLACVLGAAGASGAAPAGPTWRPVCTLQGDDLSFAAAHVESGGAARDADHAHADHATVVIEVDGAHARVRAHATAPFDFVLTTTQLASASLSLRAGTRLGGVLAVGGDGMVRLAGVAGDGRTMTVEAATVSLGGLPLRCQELQAVPSGRHYILGPATHDVSGLRRIYARPGAGAGFAISAPEPLPVRAPDAARGDWRAISYSAHADGRQGFSIEGWVRGVRLAPGGAAGGGSIAQPGFRSCAPGTPARMGLAMLPAGTALFTYREGTEAWATLAAPTRALVALYPRGRAALAGLPGWTWPGWRCETAWLDPGELRLDDQPAGAAAPARD